MRICTVINLELNRLPVALNIAWCFSVMDHFTHLDLGNKASLVIEKLQMFQSLNLFKTSKVSVLLWLQQVNIIRFCWLSQVMFTLVEAIVMDNSALVILKPELASHSKNLLLIRMCIEFLQVETILGSY